MTFEEFKQNNPSLRFDVRAAPTKVFPAFDTLTQYFLRVQDGQDIKVREVWGFCDGINIYAREGVNVWKANHMFNRIDYVGRYCLYRGISSGESGTGEVGSPSLIGSPGVMVGGKLRVVVDKAININNGRYFEITRENVEFLLQRDSKLLTEFKSDKKKRTHLIAYIRRYSEAHVEELK